MCGTYTFLYVDYKTRNKAISFPDSGGNSAGLIQSGYESSWLTPECRLWIREIIQWSYT